MKKNVALFVCIFTMLFSGYSQKRDNFFTLEDSIKRLHQNIISERNTQLRYQKNEQLLYLLEETLELKNSISHPFDSLKTISVLTSSDKKVRIFTWYLISDDGIHEHYGFIQTYNEEKQRYRICTLIDKWQRINSPAAQPLACENWYGAVYSEIIETKTLNNKTYYTLLGWNGGNIFSQRKVIDVVSIDKKGVSSFGAPIFQGYTKTRTMRVVFEYAKRSPFILRYEKQSHTEKSAVRDKKTNKYTIDTLSSQMIVFNRLIPIDESLQQIPQFMVGEASMCDAFMEKDGKWIYKPDIIARNQDKNLPPPKEVKTRTFYKPN